MKFHRLPRIAEVIRQAASETILFRLQDPRVKSVTVTRAEVSGDLQHAKVFVSIMGSPKQQKLTMHGLESATGFIQAEVAKRLQTRFTPALKFISDEGVKKSIEITRLIREGLGQKDEEPVTSENEVVKNEVEGEFEDEFEDEDDTEDGDNLDESPTNHDNRP